MLHCRFSHREHCFCHHGSQISSGTLELGQMMGADVSETDLQAVTPTAVPLLKRARMAGAESINPNSVPRAPAVAASTLVPMPPLATGVGALPSASCGSPTPCFSGTLTTACLCTHTRKQALTHSHSCAGSLSLTRSLTLTLTH